LRVSKTFRKVLVASNSCLECIQVFLTIINNDQENCVFNALFSIYTLEENFHSQSSVLHKRMSARSPSTLKHFAFFNKGKTEDISNKMTKPSPFEMSPFDYFSFLHFLISKLEMLSQPLFPLSGFLLLILKLV